MKQESSVLCGVGPVVEQAILSEEIRERRQKLLNYLCGRVSCYSAAAALVVFMTVAVSVIRAGTAAVEARGAMGAVGADRSGLAAAGSCDTAMGEVTCICTILP